MIRSIAGLILLSLLTAHAALIDFPTENRALLEGRPGNFFMYVNRDFEGEKSQPWQGGQFGFVRGPVREGDKVTFIQIHEGIDILPLQRDAQGNPLDPIKAVAAGRVVYVSDVAGASNYGKYLVIEHNWEGSPCYTLYAHLSAIAVTVGQTVRQGEVIARMGYTGSGLDRVRSHLHLEVCMMINPRFDEWHGKNFTGDPNRHGNFNGLNLVGADPTRLLIEAQRDPDLKFSDYIRSLEPSFTIGVRNTPNFDLIRRYPWLVPEGQPTNPPAWAVSFSRHGVPVRVVALDRALNGPTPLWVKDTGERVARVSKGYFSGTPNNLQFTASGRRFAQLLTWPD